MQNERTSFRTQFLSENHQPQVIEMPTRREIIYIGLKYLKAAVLMLNRGLFRVTELNIKRISAEQIPTQTIPSIQHMTSTIMLMTEVKNVPKTPPERINKLITMRILYSRVTPKPL